MPLFRANQVLTFTQLDHWNEESEAFLKLFRRHQINEALECGEALFLFLINLISCIEGSFFFLLLFGLKDRLVVVRDSHCPPRLFHELLEFCLHLDVDLVVCLILVLRLLVSEAKGSVELFSSLVVR